MKKLIILTLMLLIACTQISFAARVTSRWTTIQEEDGDPIGVLRRLRVSNDALTDNTGGDWSLGAAGSLTGLSDIGTATQGAGRIMVSDGTVFDSLAMSGDCTITAAGVMNCPGAVVNELEDLNDVSVVIQGAGRLLISDGTYFDSLAMSGDCTIDAAGVTTCTAAGVTAWDDIADPDNDGLTTIDFDHASENTSLTNIYDAAGSFFLIANSDADLANETSLLGLAFDADGDDQATYILATDNSGADTVWKLGVNGKMTIGPGAADYILPTTRGVDKSVLQDNGGGAVTFELLELTDLSDVLSSTQGGGRLLLSDGTYFHSVVMSGDIGITFRGVTSIQPNSVILGTDTYGSYAAGTGEAGSATGVACTGCVGDTDIASSGVGAGSYMSPTITVDADGRLTYAASGGLTGLSDVGSSTQSAGQLLISDGTEFQSIAMSGDCTVDKDGLMSCAGGGALADLSDVGVATQGTGRILISDGTLFDSIGISGDITLAEGGATDIQTGVVGANELASSGVGYGSYMAPTITVDRDGRLTYAASGGLTGLSDVGSSTQGAGQLLISDGTEFQSIIMSGDCTMDKDGLIDCPAGAVSQLSDLSDVGGTTQGAGRLLISDGTNFDSILPSEDCSIDQSGKIQCWEHKTFSVQASNTASIFVTTHGDFIAAAGEYNLGFDQNQDEQGIWDYKLPATFDLTAATPTLVFDYTTTVTSGDAYYNLSIMCVKENAAHIDTSSFDTSNDTNFTVPGTVGYIDRVSISISNFDSATAGDYCIFLLNRDADNGGDTAAAKIYIREPQLSHK